jgi:hypothetical protein
MASSASYPLSRADSRQTDGNPTEPTPGAVWDFADRELATAGTRTNSVLVPAIARNVLRILRSPILWGSPRDRCLCPVRDPVRRRSRFERDHHASSRGHDLTSAGFAAASAAPLPCWSQPCLGQMPDLDQPLLAFCARVDGRVIASYIKPWDREAHLLESKSWSSRSGLLGPTHVGKPDQIARMLPFEPKRFRCKEFRATLGMESPLRKRSVFRGGKPGALDRTGAAPSLGLPTRMLESDDRRRGLVKPQRPRAAWRGGAEPFWSRSEAPDEPYDGVAPAA